MNKNNNFANKFFCFLYYDNDAPTLQTKIEQQND